MRTQRCNARALLEVALLASIGCDSGGDPPLFGVVPPTTPIRLVELQGRISSDATPSTGGSRVLAQWHGDALAAWQRDWTPERVRYTSPQLVVGGLADVGRLQLLLRPGGATRVVVVPHASGSQVPREHRSLRRLTLELARDAGPETPVAMTLDLHEALHGNFGDAGRPGRLDRLEITLPAARPESAELLDVTIERRSTVDSDAPAAALVVEHQGVLRPTWFARGGVTAEFELVVPEESELRWYDAALPGTGARVVLVSGDDGTTTELARMPRATGTEGVPWRLQSRSLAKWAGQTIRVLLRTENNGVGLFGNPRVVSVSSRAPDVLVYMIDTLRADRLGVGGSSVPDVSPTIDGLARAGAWFDLALSSSPWTKPAIATLMSGILPTTHQVGATTYTDRMPATVALLQERFRDAGWRTGSFSASPLGSTLSALDRGFDTVVPPRYWMAHARLDMNPSADQLGDALLAWIDTEPDQPFFAYVHTLEVHEWKLPRYQHDLPPKLTAYDAAVRDADHHLGTLLEALRARGRSENLLVVVVSDHGESWGDHGLPSHGFGLFQSQVHIPLIFWHGRQRLAPVARGPVGLADVGPTLLDGFGLAPLEEADGESLVAVLQGGRPSRRPILSALLRFVWAPSAPRQFALTTADQVKLIRIEGGSSQSFDLVLDPRETHPRSTPSPEITNELERILASQERRAIAFRARHGAPPIGAVTHDDVERLRALGYLSTPSENGPTPTQ